MIKATVIGSNHGSIMLRNGLLGAMTEGGGTGVGHGPPKIRKKKIRNKKNKKKM
jgi:hypothetical protein